MNTNQIQLAQELINNLDKGALVSLTELYGDLWSDIPEPKVFGKNLNLQSKINSRINISSRH